MIDKLQTNYKEKLVATRESLLEQLKQDKSSMDTRLSAMRIELKALSTESSDVLGKQLDKEREASASPGRCVTSRAAVVSHE